MAERERERDKIAVTQGGDKIAVSVQEGREEL